MCSLVLVPAGSVVLSDHLLFIFLCFLLIAIYLLVSIMTIDVVCDPSRSAYKCHVLPCGMKNAPGTFQRTLPCQYWELRSQDSLHAARLVRNLQMWICGCQCSIPWLCCWAWPVTPDSTVKTISNFPPPHNRRELRRFLGCIPHYRRVLMNFATLVTPVRTSKEGKDLPMV